MAKTKERQASSLTLAAHKCDAEALISRALGHNASANSPASLAVGSAVPLAEGLAYSPGLANQTAAGAPVARSHKRGSIEPVLKAQGSRTPKMRASVTPAAIRGRKREPRQPGPILREPAPIPGNFGDGSGPTLPLGPPLRIRDVAEMLGCSPWTVRQTLIPRGLPHFRFRASGRLTFYRDQVIRWIENQQGGNTTS
jgi:hypothetical protein